MVKRNGDVLADNLIKSYKIIFGEYQFTRKIMPDTDNFFSEKLQEYIVQKAENLQCSIIII